MSLSLGGLALFSLRNPFYDLLSGKADVRSWLCLIVFTIVSLVLAYLTNPSESSFRAYLTEQSFRLHLSRLDDQVDHLPPPFSLANPPALSLKPSPPFYFTNRASISLRTPKHVFHTFAIFTVAAMVPLSNPEVHDNGQWSISDSWYIGAFGKWWRGGVLEAWYQDVIAHAKDEESWTSGILSIKRLDMLPGYRTPPFSTKALPPHLGKCSPPRLRNRERTMLRHKPIQPRTQTPPPLPESVSLPMHSSKKLFLPAEIPLDPEQHQHAVSQSCTVQAFGSSLPLPLSMERSPLIAEALRQLSAAKTSFQDLNEQLSDCRSSAAQSHAMLQHDVGDYRRRKLLEDITKNEIRSRTKGLEESKRVAESLRREAEKKLKTVQLFRQDTSQHLDHADQEILALKGQLCDDQDFLLEQHSIPELQSGLAGALEQRRLEIKAAESQAVFLNQRSRELEEKLTSAKSRLKLLQGRSGTLKHEFSNCPGDVRFPSFSAGYPSPQLYHQDGCLRPVRFPSSIGKKQPPPLETSEALLYSPMGYLPFGEQPVDRPAIFDCSGSWFQANDERTTLGAVSNTGHSSGAQCLSTPVHHDSITQHYQLGCSPPGCCLPDPPRCRRSKSRDANSSNLSNHPPGDTSFTGDLLEPQLMGSFDLTHACSNANPCLPIEVPAVVSPNLSDDLSVISNTLPHQPDSSAEMKIMQVQNPDPSSLQFRSPFDTGGLYALGTDGSSSPASTSPSHSLIRAFAPSPAERRALRQALGISTSTSFERLANMSDIRTMSTSPTRSHLSMSIIGKSSTPSTTLPDWLPNPPVRKANFSPWADEDDEDTVASINEPEH